jgi:protein gp37
MNKTTIDWPWKPLWTWNPVVGCKHGCSYCYARRMNQRFKYIPKWEDPQVFEERFDEPAYLKKPSNIFVGSMCDLFGAWVPRPWIREVIRVCERIPRHTFMFLTKNPARYAEFDFPENCWLGVTATKWTDVIYWPWIHKSNKKFLSAEPLLGEFLTTELKCLFDLVIVGAMTGPGAVIPKKEWIDSIQHPNIFYKDNIKKYLK